MEWDTIGLDRRTFVAIAGAASLGGAAGCSGLGPGSDDGPSGYPPYAAWLSAQEDMEFFVRTDFTIESEIDGFNLDKQTSLQEEDKTKQIGPGELFPDISSLSEALPASTATSTLFLLGFSAVEFPFLNNIDFVGTDKDVENPVITVETLMLVDKGIILEGEISTDALESRDDVTEEGSHGEYTIYEAEYTVGGFQTGGNESTTTQTATNPFAVGTDSIVLPFRSNGNDNSGEPPDKRSLLETILDVQGAGVAIGNESLEWLVQHVGDGAMVFGAADEDIQSDDGEDGSEEEDPDFSEFDIDPATYDEFDQLLKDNEAEGSVMATGAHEDGRVSRSGFAFPDANSVPDVETMVDLLAPGAANVETTTEDGNVLIEAVWDSA